MKIICHGDSLTEGSDIEKAYIWSSLVEHNLRVPVLDFHRLFLDDQGRVKTSLFLEDGLHAAKGGHRVMGIYAAKTIKEVFHLA